MTAETSCRHGRKQFPGVAWQPSVIFMSHTHTQVKASPALQILIGPSVMALRLHMHPLALPCPASPQLDWGPPSRMALILSYLRSVTLHISPFPLSIPLSKFSESHGKAEANTSIPSFLLCIPSLPPPCFLLEIFIVSYHHSVCHDSKTFAK